MADAAQNSFESLTQSGIIRVNAKEDRNVSLSLDTYGGNTSLCVFTGAGGKPWKVGLPRKMIQVIVALLRKMREAPRPCREPIFLNEYVEQDGKKGFKQYGCIGIGIDESLVLFIDIAANSLQGRHMFLLKAQDGRFDFSNTTLAEKDQLVAAIDWVIDSLLNTTNIAERISSFKRTGGQRPAGGGGYSGGNKSYGGGNSSPPKQSTFGGAAEGGELYV